MLQNDQTQNFAQGSTVTNVWPATGTCWHTHVCCRIDQCRVAPRVKVYRGLADQMLLGAYTCVLQNRRTQGCTQGSGATKVWPTSYMCVAVGTHAHAVAEYVSSGLHPSFKGYKGFADQVVTRAYTYVLQKSGLHQGIEVSPGLRRPTAAASIHMRVAD